MNREVVKMLYSRDEQSRVEIFRRKNGTFGFEDWGYYPEEDSWGPRGGYSYCIVESLEAALREATGRVSWLAEESDS